MINLNSINLGSINLGGMNTSEIKLGYPSSDSPVPGLKGLQGLYMGKGLTNEMMSRDPVWRDKSGKGNHIQLKNFAWAEKSGVGMYANDLTRWVSNNESVFGIKKTSSKIECTNTNSSGSLGIFARTSASSWNNTEVNVKAGDKGLIFYSISVSHGNEVVAKIEPNKTGKIKISDEMFSRAFLVGCGPVKNVYKGDSFSWEILPYAYENALCFDGVDDYGICETFPIFTKEKGYTVMALRKWISREPDFVILVTNTYSWNVNGCFTLEYKNHKNSYANSFGKANVVNIASGAIVYQTSESYNGNPILTGDSLGTNTVLLSRSAVSGFQFYSSFALYALAIIDHDTTAEERQLVIDYWKKEYPELFPDQAWTVAGKTNSDADKATVKNITGNGNDLVLTNFGFAENSGYGRYYQYFGKYFVLTNTSDISLWYKINDYTIGITNRLGIDSTYKCYWQSTGVGNSIKLKFKVTGLQENDVLKFGTQSNYSYSYDKDGTYVIDFSVTPATYGFSLQSSLEVDTPTTEVRVEILPFDYEGYLLTDGVDDSIASSNFIMSENWTMVGDWKFTPPNKDDNAGFHKSKSFYIYNYTTGARVYINNNGAGLTMNGSRSVKAVCSDGRIYLDDWTEVANNIVQTSFGANTSLIVGNNGNNYTQMAFKNLGIYNDAILTKDQCIRAYNYLQTIKNN